VIEALRAWLPRVEDAARELGLDPGDIEFRVVPGPVLYEAVAYQGLGGYSHWTRGRDYWLTKARLERGHGRLYEVVFPGRPPVAYLLEGNTFAAQVLVMAHVMGHVHLFRHHVLSRPDDDWAETQIAARQRFQRYAEAWGRDRLEQTLDAALAIRDLVADDPPLRPPPPPREPHPFERIWDGRPWPEPEPPPRYRLPTGDVLGFIARESPVLQEWQRDVLLVVRQEGFYRRRILPIKTIHESFAAWVHREILRRLPLPDQDAVEAMAVHARVVAPDPLGWNPYSLFRMVDLLIAEHGQAATLRLLAEETDASLVRNWLTRAMWEELGFYGYRWEPDPREPHTWEVARRTSGIDDEGWRTWRNRLADELAAIRPPDIRVVDVGTDHQLRLALSPGELPLDRPQARHALRLVKRLWGASVRLDTPDWSETTA
jgi:stage V sporulation protein R